MVRAAAAILLLLAPGCLAPATVHNWTPQPRHIYVTPSPQAATARFPDWILNRPDPPAESPEDRYWRWYAEREFQKAEERVYLEMLPEMLQDSRHRQIMRALDDLRGDRVGSQPRDR